MGFFVSISKQGNMALINPLFSFKSFFLKVLKKKVRYCINPDIFFMAKTSVLARNKKNQNFLLDKRIDVFVVAEVMAFMRDFGVYVVFVSES